MIVYVTAAGEFYAATHEPVEETFNPRTGSFTNMYAYRDRELTEPWRLSPASIIAWREEESK